MSTESGFPWPPQTNSAKSGGGPEEPDSESRRSKTLDELPSPTEKVREFLDEFGERAHLAMSQEHGRELRSGAFEEETEISKYVMESGGTEEVEEVVERRAVPWWQTVANMLEWHADYHRSRLRLEYGQESDPTHEVLDVDLENSWFAAYQDKERAKLKALERETVGFETCEECETRYCQDTEEHETEWVEGDFGEPIVALSGRTSSGAGRPPVDHARAIAEAWANGGVRRSLRYILETKLGLENDEWVRWTQGEPHPGEGENQGYHHAHDIVILDGAAASEPVEEITAAEFKPVIDAHVAEVEHAGPRAHDLDASAEEWENGDVETVSVKHVEGEIEESVASYAAAYLANESKDLLERSPEYLAWAASMWATETQKGIKSDSANHAIKADKCKHEHATGEKETEHGERVIRRNIRGGSQIVCASCGSPWGIDQEQTLASARMDTADVAADGGREGPQTREESVEEELRNGWERARSAGVVGSEVVKREVVSEPEMPELEGKMVRLGGGEDWCPACHTENPETEECPHEEYEEHPIIEGRRDADVMATTGSERFRGSSFGSYEFGESVRDVETVTAGFVRPPSWSAKAIIRDGEEIPASGGTSNRKPLDLPSAPESVVSMASSSAAVLKCEACGDVFDTIPGYLRHGCDSGRVGVGWLAASDPPAEESAMSREEFVECVPERYEPGEPESESDGDLDSEPQLAEEVVRYIENNPSEPAAVVAGRFNLPSERLEEIRAA